MKLYKITSQMINAYERVDDPEAKKDILDFLEDELNKKSDNIIKIFNKENNNINEIDNEIKRLQELKKTRGKKHSAFKECVSNCILHMKKTKIKTSLGELCLRKSTAVIIDSVEDVQPAYKKIKKSIVIDKISLKKDLEISSIPGAHLETRYNLNIK